ncbi:MAG TPA: TolC family protein [Steroidobacteraceae bacterium]|nr:TolC family protein [Steroidobacteraceae bacterium]
MKRASIAVAGLAFACALAGVPVCAESLADAWQMAQENDFAVAAAAADVDSARAAERAAQASRLPALDASAGYTRFSTAPQFQFSMGGTAVQAPIFSGDDFRMAGVEMKLPLYTGGRITNSIAAARQETTDASATERAERASLRLDVARTYIDVLRARRMLLTAESTVSSLTAHVSDVSSMVERELVARSDLLAARVALANAEQQRVSAENGVALAEAAYNRRLGQPLGRKPDLATTLVPPTIEIADSPDALVATALQTRSELQAFSARKSALELKAQAERATLLPQIAVSGGYSYVANTILDRQDFSMVSVGVRWNLFDGGQARNRSASLRAASRATQRRIDDLRSQIELQVREAWLDVREARNRKKAAAEAVAQAEENLRISRELYGTGLATNTQVLDAIALQITATNNRDNASLDETLALYELAYAEGTL